jgi:hypothetical protein
VAQQAMPGRVLNLGIGPWSTKRSLLIFLAQSFTIRMDPKIDAQFIWGDP